MSSPFIDRFTQSRAAFRVWLTRRGFRGDFYLLFLAVIIGAVTAAAAVGFHQLIGLIRDNLYLRAGEQTLYNQGLVLLILYPALGGLMVGLVSRFVFRVREGHGIVDVLESVIRSSGFQRPLTALEKIVTAGITIGSGGSAGAEGPIVQIGAGIASGVGQLFGVARNHMPILIGCGAAAGISAIFNAPFGGVLFTLEVILQDFSVRAFTPVVVASVFAQVTELLLFDLMHKAGEFHPIFDLSPETVHLHSALEWGQVGNFIFLGIICGVAGLGVTRLMDLCERLFARVKCPDFLKPAIGGGLVGVIGVTYVLVFGRLYLHVPKPVSFQTYPMPAFFGDGYGFIEKLLAPEYYQNIESRILVLLAALLFLKILATCLTLGSGGSGGVIAPSLFVGAAAGAVLGTLLRNTGWFGTIHPEMYALVGMGAALAAVVHAPLASILICFEVTEDYKVMVPAMLACIIAAAVARLIYSESIYTQTLRRRGIRTGSATDFTVLRRMSVEQVALEPASLVHPGDPFQKVLDLTVASGASHFVVADDSGGYLGMIIDDDIKTALLQREAIPFLLVGELMRKDLPPVRITDDLATVLDAFSRHEVSHLPVVMEANATKVIGLVSGAGLMRRYYQSLSES